MYGSLFLKIDCCYYDWTSYSGTCCEGRGYTGRHLPGFATAAPAFVRLGSSCSPLVAPVLRAVCASRCCLLLLPCRQRCCCCSSTPAAAAVLSCACVLLPLRCVCCGAASGGHGRSSGAAVAAAAAAQAAGMSCCSDAPPGWLVRLFLRLGLPLPAFLRVHARHYRSPCLLSYSDSSSHQLSDTQHSDSSTGWKRNSSSSSIARASTSVTEDDTSSTSTCGAWWNSSSVRGEGDEAAGAAGATGDVEDTSGPAALRAAMCAMPQQLQVWGEYFCRQEERWIACTFFSSSLMIHDAADMLAGRTSAVDVEARGAPTLLGGAATRTAPRAPAAAARLKRMSSKRLAAFLGISALFLDTSSRAAGAPGATGLATGEAAAKASRVAMAACRTSTSKTAPGQQRTAARAVCDFLPTIKERWQAQQQQPAAESLQRKLDIGELQAEEKREEQQRKAWQACQQQGAEAAKVHPDSGAKKVGVVEEAAAAATPQQDNVQLGQLLLFTRPRRSQESAARDRRGEASDSSAAASYRTAAGRSRRKTALTAAASSSDPEGRALPDSPDSSTSPSESPTRSLCRGGEERGGHRQLHKQQQQQQHQGQDQQQEKQRRQQWEQQMLHRGLRRQPEKLLQVEPEDQHSAEDEQGTRVASSPRAEGRRSRVNAQGVVKDVGHSAFLCCFPVVVELPPLLFFFHSPRNLSIIVFPFSVVTAAPISAPRGGRTPETSTAPRLTGTAAERTCGSRSAAEASGAAAHDFVNEHKASSRYVADKRMPTAVSTCSSTGERCCDAAVRADASSLSEGAFSFARGQVLTFSIPRPRPTAETSSSSALAASQSLSATAAGTGLLQALQIRMESVPPPLPSLSGAATASRGAAAAVLLVVLLLLKLLQLQGFFNVAPAVVAFVLEAAKRVLLTEAASAADVGAEEGGRRAATGAGNAAAAKREHVSVSTQHLQQQQLQQQQVQQQQLQQQRERILQHFKFPFEVEEERYTLAAELSAAWRKAASSSSSSAATARRARSARSNSNHRPVQPVLQQPEQRSDRGAGSRSNSGSRRSVNQGSSSRGSSEERYFQFNHTGLTSRSPSSRRSGSPPPVETAPTSSASRTTSNSSPASARSGRDLSNSRSSTCSGMTTGGNITAASHALASARFGGAAASRERLGIDFIRATRQRGSRVAKHVSPPLSNVEPPRAAFPSSALVRVQSTSAAAAAAPCSAARSHVAAAEATETRSAVPPEAPPAAATPGPRSRQSTLSAAAAAADLGVAAAAAVAAARFPGVGDRPACAAAATAAVAAEPLSARDVIIVPSEDEEADEAARAAAAVVDAAGGAAGGPASIPQQPPNPAAVAGSPAAASSGNRDPAASPAAVAAPFFAAAAGPLAAERQFVLAIDETERVTDVSFRYTSSWRRVLEGRQRRLQHWWTSAGTQRLLLPKQQQQQRGERRKRQKQEQQEQQQQHQEPTGPPEGQTKVRRRDDVRCTSEAAAAERKEVEELQSGSSSESSVPKTSRGNRSEEEEEQEQQTTEAEEDFIIFEDEDVGKSHVPQGQQEPQNLDNGGGEGAAAMEEEAATSCRRTGVRRRISSAAERSESEAGAAAAEPVLGRTGRADKVEEEATAEEKAKEQQQEEEEATRRAEERERQELLAKEPLPTSRAGFKLHPKFVLSSDLKPFEYIPPGTRPAAFFGGELVFLRADVRVLKSERQWLRLRRKVKTGEGPLRIVTRRIPQLPAAGGGRRVQWLNPLLQQMDGFGRRDAQNSSGSGANPAGPGDREKVGLYAEWQTEVLPPLRVENGVLPVNEKGNIEVGKLGAVPIGAVHISLEEFCCEGEERSGSRASERRSSSNSSSRRQRTCLSAGSLGGALTAAAAACGVQWAPAVVGFELDTKRHLQQQARWVVQRDGIVVLKDDEARVRQQWAEERIRREKVWQQRRQRREQRDREEAAMRWRVLCRALLYWREQQQREGQRQGDQQEHP